MEFQKIMQIAKEKAGSQKQLAALLEVSESAMSDMMKGRRPIPAEQLRRIALVIGDGITPGQIWEAQQAARAETEEERQLWLPFVKAQGVAHVASLLMTWGLGALLAVTLFLTPAGNAQAKSMAYDSAAPVIKIIAALRRKLKRQLKLIAVRLQGGMRRAPIRVT